MAGPLASEHRQFVESLHRWDVLASMAVAPHSLQLSTHAAQVREDAIIVNATGKTGGNALLLGDVSKHIVCTPDMMSLLR